ncbi:hypothetical protein OROMI_018968 [Orobanche minor]
MLQAGGGSLRGLSPVATSSNKKRKVELQALAGVHVVAPPEPTISKNVVLSFSNQDREGLLCPKEDALVVSTGILGKTIDRILVDNGSFCNIIYKSALDQLGNLTKFIKPFETVLKGFGDYTVKAYGRIKLPVELVCSNDPK